MKRSIKVLGGMLLLLLTSLSVPTFAQLSITTPDTVVCPNQPATLNAVMVGRVPNVINLPDDGYSPTIAIGFPFTFYGNTYNNCVIASNGYIRFDVVSGGSGYVISNPLPGIAMMNNSVIGHGADIYPPNSGVVDWALVGTAPNRRFVVTFCAVAMYSCTSLKTSFQMILFEGSNNIEIHQSNIPNCLAWNSGYAVEGLQNATGTIAHVVPGRNVPTLWTSYHSSHLFVPTSPTTYSISAIGYNPIPNANATITWLAGGTTAVGTGTSVTVTPTANTFYVARVISCQDTLTDVVNVTLGGGPKIDSIKKVDPPTCGGTGFVNIYGLEPNTSYVVQYTKNSLTFNQPVLANSAGVVSITGTSGTYSAIRIFKGTCFSNTVGPITLVDPPLTADFSFNIHYGCTADTVLFTNLSQTPGPMTYEWSYGDGTFDTATNPSHFYIPQSIYLVQLRASNGICNDSISKPVDVTHPLDATFTTDKDSLCQGGSVTFNNTSTTTTKFGIDPTYFWDFGDGLTSTTASPVHSYPNYGIYRVKLVVTDFVPCTDTAYKTIVVDSLPYAKFTASDTVLCEGQTIIFDADYLPIGNTGISWDMGDGTLLSDVDPVTHAYDTAGTFTVKLKATYRLCPDVDAERDFTIREFPSINLGPDTVLCPNGSPIVIQDRNAAANTGAQYSWSNGETANNFILAHAVGNYYATVSRDGCSSTDSVEVQKDCYLDVPNAFTPNGDGDNDYFLPRQLLSRSLTRFTMSIYNRWGLKIFETNSLNGRGWDGKFNGADQPTGVYIYMIEADMENDTHEKLTGNVTLMR